MAFPEYWKERETARDTFENGISDSSDRKRGKRQSDRGCWRQGQSQASKWSGLLTAESEPGAVNIAIKGGSDTSSKDHTLKSAPTTLHNERHSLNSLSTKAGRDNGEPADGQRWSMYYSILIGGNFPPYIKFYNTVYPFFTYF